MPAVSPLLQRDGAVKEAEFAGDIEHEVLWLPSALPGCIRVEGCLGGVDKIEEKLCEAQCLDTLDTLCGITRAKQEMFAYRDANIDTLEKHSHV